VEGLAAAATTTSYIRHTESTSYEGVGRHRPFSLSAARATSQNVREPSYLICVTSSRGRDEFHVYILDVREGIPNNRVCPVSRVTTYNRMTRRPLDGLVGIRCRRVNSRRTSRDNIACFRLC